MQLLFLLQTAFTIWMLVDAVRRGSPFYWYIIIMFPFGEWVYFFAVKIHDPQFKKFTSNLFTKRAGLKQLRYNAQMTPSVQNKLLLAQALHDHRDYSEAITLFEEILQRDKAYKEALYGLAQCRIQRGEKDLAIKAFGRLADLDITFADYSASIELATLLWRSGEKQASMELLEKIVTKSMRMSHMIDLAKCYSLLDRKEDARDLLQQALEDYENSPTYVKRNDQKFVKVAKSLLSKLGQA